MTTAPSRPIGYVVLPVAEYLDLIGRGEKPGPPASGLATAVGLVTARRAGLPADLARVAPGSDPAAVIRMLVVLVSAMLGAATLDDGAELLARLGLEGARDGTPR